MKIIILALSVISVTCLQYPLRYSYHPYDYQVDAYAKPQPYNFGYDIHNEYGDRQWQQEQGDEYGNKQGSYGYADAYGISRQVDYIADEGGFRANVKTNEPGTANQNPADVNIYSDVVPVKYDARPYGYARPVAYGYARPAHSYVRRAVY
ncbi:cuticle protein 10.9-like [Tachypleus tridentatus]|uniref:cuticle protein 10.9-like n=1 Tax=Tachypleus tridentatus TaxID=6853 RepID=UPI003FD27F49